MEENLSNALLMAGAMIVFVIAITVTFSLISQTKSTSDIVLYSYDDTQYYEEGYEGITYTLADENDLNRKVDMKAIIPTVYRYIKEHYGVTIMDNKGNILARFDETTESIVNNWETYLKKSDPKCKNQYDNLKNLAAAAGLEEEFEKKYKGYNDLTALWKEIYYLDKTSGNTRIKYGTPWLGNEANIAKRLKVDFGGGTAKYSSGVHTGLNLLNKYSKNKFKEIYLFVSDDEGIVTDDETGDSIITKANTTKLEIIYVMED